MARISFCFSGWVSGANVNTAMDCDCNDVDVSDMPVDELVSKLESGELMISLSDCLDNCKKNEIEIFDFAQYP